MKQHIDKSALVAEIESKRKYAQTLGDNAINSSMQQFYDGMKQSCVDILSFIDTLEVTEADLERELDKEWNKCEPIDEGMGLEIASIEHEQFDNIAKHFFELGMQVSNKAQKGEKV